ncbi:MAG: geranylgeranyl reductase family protein [Streptosporangiaceae bacterium]
MNEFVTEADIWDVAVIGAGPAGATAARAAALAGSRVILLERATLPRYKTCGGGLINASMRTLPDRLALNPRAQVRSFSFSFDGKREKTRTRSEPLLTLVMRDEFDAALVDRATEAGVTLSEATTVLKIAEDGDLVRLSTREHGDILARVVVGADGSAGRSSAYVGVTFRQVDLGLEAEIPTPPEQVASWEGRILIDFGHDPGSYGWVFAKGDVLSVGVIAARGDADATRAYLAEFTERLGLAGIEPRISTGHLTRCRERDSPLARGRVLVAGDAAGLLEPWTREGISFALRSGRHAGQAAAAAATAETRTAIAGYTDAVKAELEPEMLAGQAFLEAFIRHPAPFYRAVAQVPAAWRLFVRMVAGQTTFAEAYRNRIIRLMLAGLSRW